jgi:hypothetical protein
MIRSRRTRAAAAFAAMCELDESAREIAELRASGVSEQRIDALYPESPFASIAANLSARLPRIAPAYLAAMMNSSLDEAHTDFSTRVNDPLVTKIYDQWAAGQKSDADARAAFARTIDAHRGLPGDKGSAHSPYTYGAENAVSACWWAWFGMTNRARLPRSLRGRADKLMLAVSATFDLS